MAIRAKRPKPKAGTQLGVSAASSTTVGKVGAVFECDIKALPFSRISQPV
jgi:hypothetical protein